MPDDAFPMRADLAFRGGTLIDGTGRPGVRADLAVSGDRIVAIGALGRLAAQREVDATGCVLAPGFIDVHTHDDKHLLTHPEMAPKASQGVTTVVCGNCGISLAPAARALGPSLLDRDGRGAFATVAGYMAALEATPPALNSALLVGHSTLRLGCMDDLKRPARDRELAAMQGLLREGLEAGAIGLSSGLFYPEAAAAETAEVAALAEVLGPWGAVYTAHMRDEGEKVLEAIEETAAIGRAGGVRTVISHHKCTGRPNFGRSRETLAAIARLARRQPLHLDLYPYTASSTRLLPQRTLIADRVLITWSEAMPGAGGRDLDEIAAELGLGRAEAAERLQPAGAIYFAMDEADVRRILAYPDTMIGSDGIPDDEKPHPRLWGTFPRVLGHYAREEGVLTLEEAVRRMTGLPAQVFGFADRGVLRPGAFADLVLFDPATVIDRATFAAPTLPAAGIRLVLVNGVAVWDGAAPTGARPGRPLKLGAGAAGRRPPG